MKLPRIAPRMHEALSVAKMSLWDSLIPGCRLYDSEIYWPEVGPPLLGLDGTGFVQPFQDFITFVHDDDRQSLVDAMQGAINSGGSYEIEYRVCWRDGSEHWLAARASIQLGDGGARSLGMVWDISRRKRAELELAQQKELAEVTLASIADGVITVDKDGKPNYLNRVAEQVTGWSGADLERGLSLRRLFHVVDEKTGEMLENVALKCLRLQETVGLHSHGKLLTRSGKLVPIENSASPIHGQDGRIMGAVIIFRDVSHERALKNELTWNASHDPLTGLPNRRAFAHCVADALASAKDDRRRHALLFIDLDQFKIVNDTCGHAAGDMLLKILSNMLHSCMREADVLARLGGDEFAALLFNCPPEQANDIAHTLRRVVRDFRFAWEGRTFQVGASIGMVSIDEDSKSASELLTAADQACYAAKELGRNRVHIYKENDVLVAKRRGEALWVPRLNEAVQKGRFVLYTQPIVHLHGKVPDHYEVLIRMVNDDGDQVLPGAFIPAAERYDAMIPIDRWVIETVCRWIGRASQRSVTGISEAEDGSLYSVNLSAQSLNDAATADFIAELFEKHAVEPSRICFEVTETAAIANLDTASSLMYKIKSLGCSFALDDFGSGFSSFAYLKMLPVDYLKIDGLFIRDIHANTVNEALVRAINDVGHVMGMKTIAEYVEDKSILGLVREMGIDFGQGYALGNLAPFSGGRFMQ